MNNIYDINVDNISGENLSLEEFKGNVILIVNTASRCGFTSQYSELENLFNKYKDKGFTILAFPSNNFMNQEPGSNKEIEEFCKINYGISFPIFSKVEVKGSNKHPLFEFLTSKNTNPKFGGPISWNFNKFLISPDGKIVNRFGSMTSPLNKKVILSIEKYLP
ncbi:MAG: glutathione peroxidase [Verrucomicrobiota bacterium]|nr:glutathione peroxidase [Verrucomicrobiota bacterium]